jgi:hypothetical protein
MSKQAQRQPRPITPVEELYGLPEAPTDNRRYLDRGGTSGPLGNAVESNSGFRKAHAAKMRAGGRRDWDDSTECVLVRLARALFGG